ncbi:hypothetical protein PABG_03828 [Paracoccidioides brasiliensis Pb03]|nr:hypothetical protein PABG_03828 [Paracoccidioides brasiliensis Pb03]
MSSVQVELKTRRCYHFIRMARGYSFSRLLNCFFVRWDIVAVFPEITEDVVATPSPALRISDTSSGDGTKVEPSIYREYKASRQLPEKFLTRSLKDLEDVQQGRPVIGQSSWL